MIEFKELQQKYGGQFIAILDDKVVVASAGTFNSVLSYLKEHGLTNKPNLVIRFIRKGIVV